MNQGKTITGVIFVGSGAAMYGMLATCVKIAYEHHYTTAEVTTAQLFIGLLCLMLINFLRRLFRKDNSTDRATKKDFRKLVLAGICMSATSLFYYLSVQFINVSIGVVLLMQSVWMSVVLESILQRKFPSVRKILAVFVVLFGTVLATNAIHSTESLDIRGIFWGILAAISYTIMMYASNTIATYLSTYKKTLIMLLGGGIIITLFLIFSQLDPLHSETLKNAYLSVNSKAVFHTFDFSIFWTYGILLAVFGTILPPILYNYGFPMTGLGLGSIVSSIELPFSVSYAHFLLGEPVYPIQWAGIGLILLAIIWMNLPSVKE